MKESNLYIEIIFVLRVHIIIIIVFVTLVQNALKCAKFNWVLNMKAKCEQTQDVSGYRTEIPISYNNLRAHHILAYRRLSCHEQDTLLVETKY